MDKNLAIETLRGFLENLDNTKVKEAILELHPELAESKDEKMRKLNLWFLRKYKEISRYPGNSEEGIDMVIAYFEKQKAQKLAEWSEVDKSTLNSIIRIVHKKSIGPLDEMDDRSRYKEYENFLKSLPTRFSLQPNQEWSEEDKKRIKQLIYDTEAVRAGYEKKKEQLGSRFNETLIKDCDEQIAWLESLLSRPKPSGNWKPSEDQMDALRYAKQFDYGGVREFLESLYEDLKEL